MTKEVRTTGFVRVIDYDPGETYELNIYYKVNEATEETRLTFDYEDSVGAELTWEFTEPSCKSYRDILDAVIDYLEKQSIGDTDLYCSTFSKKNQLDKVLMLLKKVRHE